MTLDRFEGLQQNQQIVEDFTSRTLKCVPSQYGRLLYLASLRDLATGRYVHEGLASVYSVEAVQQALADCHQELFDRLLELPLEEQETDLIECLGSLEGDFDGVLGRWLEVEFYRLLVPLGAPAYLRDLFCANVRTLLNVLSADRTAQPC